MRAVILFVLALGILILPSCFGCDRLIQKAGETAAERAIESASGGDVDVDFSDGGMNVQSKDGNVSHQFGDSAELPDGWLKQFPRYPGSKITSSHSTSDKDDIHMGVSMTTSDSADKVIEFYSSKATGAGYSSQSQYSTQGHRTEVFEGSDYIFSINCTESDKENMIVLTLQSNDSDSDSSDEAPPEDGDSGPGSAEGSASVSGDAAGGKDDSGGHGNGGAGDGEADVFDSTGKIPDGFPVQVLKTYTGAVVTAAAMSDGNHTLMQETADSREKVTQFYDDHFTGRGWSIDSKVEVPQTTIHTYKSSSGEIMMSAVEEQGKVQIALNYATK